MVPAPCQRGGTMNGAAPNMMLTPRIDKTRVKIRSAGRRFCDPPCSRTRNRTPVYVLQIEASAWIRLFDDEDAHRTAAGGFDVCAIQIRDVLSTREFGTAALTRNPAFPRLLWEAITMKILRSYAHF